ncbi:MAG: ferritin family protein [Halanaerobiales bacterium]|nr:ferritin family protein [Halanaerobiales bacterium]
MLKNQFNVLEMLEMAKEIEKRGIDLYSQQAKEIDDPKLKKLFNKLASDENEHYNKFDKLEKEYQDMEKVDYSYLEDREVNSYLRSLVEYEIFPKGEKKQLEGLDIDEVLEIAINSEKHTILLYQELIPYNDEKTKEILYKLIGEEKGHYVDLISYKNKRR